MGGEGRGFQSWARLLLPLGLACFCTVTLDMPGYLEGQATHGNADICQLY